MVSTELNFRVIYLFVVNELNSISQDFQLENFIQDLMYDLSVPFIFIFELRIANSVFIHCYWSSLAMHSPS